jgi:hypothetical protein
VGKEKPSPLTTRAVSLGQGEYLQVFTFH